MPRLSIGETAISNAERQARPAIVGMQSMVTLGVESDAFIGSARHSVHRRF